MRNIYKILAGLTLFACIAYAAGVPQKFATDVLQFGISSSADNKEIRFDVGDGATNPKLKTSVADKRLAVSTDLVVEGNGVLLGDGTNTTDKLFEVDAGLAGLNPKLKFDFATQAFQFANDGVNFRDIGAGSGAGAGFNVLQDVNPDFEAGDPPKDWVTTGLGSFTAFVSAPLFGEQSAVWNPGAGAETVGSAIVQITPGMVSRSCAVAFDYTFVGGTEGHINVEVLRTGSVSETLVSSVVPVAETAKPFIQFFTCPDNPADSLQFRLVSTDDAVPFVFDNVFIGTGRAGFAGESVKQQSMFGTGGNRTGSGDVLNFVIARNTGAVDELFVWSGNFITAVVDHYATVSYHHNSQQTSAGAQILEGPGGSQVLLAQDNCANNTFDCSASWSGLVTAGQIIRFATSNDMSSGVFSYTATQVKPTVKETLNVETSGTFFRSYIQATNSSDIFLPAGAATDENLSSSFFEMVDVDGNVDIACDNTEVPSGDTCSGAEDLGFAFIPVVSGNHNVCFNFQTKVIGAAAQGVLNQWQMDRVNASTNTVIERGLVTASNGGYDSASGSSDYYDEIDFCNIFELEAGIKHTFKLSRTTSVINNAPNSNRVLRVGDSVNGLEKLMTITVRNIDQQVPSPVFKDVKDSLQGKLQASRPNMVAYACGIVTTAPVTFDPDQDNCEDWIQSSSKVVAGNVNYTFIPGIFGKPPTCVGSAVVSDSDTQTLSIQGVSTTNMQVLSKTDNSGLADMGYSIICYGEK